MRISDWSSDVCSSDLRRWADRAADLSATRSSPTGASVMDTLGWILPDGDKDLERAAALLERAHEATPGSGTIGYHDAVALHRIGRDSAARQLLQSLLREARNFRSEEHTTELQTLLRISYDF